MSAHVRQVDRRRGWGLERVRWDVAVVGAGVVSFMACAAIVAEAGTGTRRLLDHAGLVLTFVLGIAVGELFRMTLPTGRVLTPITTASAIGLVFMGRVHGEPLFTVRAAVVVVIVSVSLVLGMVLRTLAGMTADIYLLAARVVGVAIIGGLWRQLHVGGRMSLFEWQNHPRTPVWQIALAMVGVSLVGIAVERVLTGLVRAQQQRARWASVLRDEFREAPYLTLAVVAVPPALAMAAPVAGVLAFPLAIVPMVVLYVAVRRLSGARLTYRQTIVTLSRLTEASAYTPTDHAHRVAALATALGRALGLHERELRNLEYAALLHDLGQVGLRTPIPGGATVQAAPGDQRSIAREGARILRHTPVLDQVATLVEAQATPYHRVRELGEEVPLASRIIRVANAYDDLTQGDLAPMTRARALERIQLGLGYEYDPEVVDVLASVTAPPVVTD